MPDLSETGSHARRGGNRWLIVAAGTALQLCLGTVYAWSYFQKPLMEIYGWSHSQVIGAFSVAICCLGLMAAWGGVQLPRFGPRKLAVAGGLFFGLGYLAAAIALHFRSLPLLYLGYGVVGGCGLGLGYVTPVATVAQWFPDRKGLATGVVIMGFGFGALVMSKLIAPALVQRCGGNYVAVFAWLGAGLGSVSMLVALLLKNPPTSAAQAVIDEAGEATATELILSGRFLLIWGIFFANILAGISIIGLQSPLFQSLWKSIDPSLSAPTLATYGASLIAISSLFNGLGRMLWGGLSDRWGRLTTFRLMLASQIAAFGLLAVAGTPWLFAGLVCYILLCYGGGFGTLPAMVLDTFGPRRMAAVYGAMLTAWSAGGIAGPLWFAFLTDRYGAAASRYAFLSAAGCVTAGLMLTLAMNGIRQHSASGGVSPLPVSRGLDPRRDSESNCHDNVSSHATGG